MALLRRLLEFLGFGCRHDGRMVPLRTLPPGVEIWECANCHADVVVADRPDLS